MTEQTTTHTGRTPTGSGRHRRPAKPTSFRRELPVLLGVAFVVALLIKTFVVQPFFIPSGSMENTLQVGDRVLVNKVVYHVRDIGRGDIVVFNGVDSFTPEVAASEPSSGLGGVLQSIGRVFGLAAPDERDFVKRVIGVGGDRVVCCDKAGRVTVNGKALAESSYVFAGDRPSEQRFDVLVPEGKLWVMGDHRAASSDSRAHQGEPGGGFVPTDRVIGRAFVVVWPTRDAQILSVPDTFATVPNRPGRP